MSELPKPPGTYEAFVGEHEKLAKAWDLMADAGAAGPLDKKAQRLVKLAIAVGASREGAVHASVRKGLAAGLTKNEMQQVIALSASTIGMPGAVAAYSWIRDLVK